MNESASWLSGYQSTVSLCFDVDAESAWVLDTNNHRRLSLLSAAAFGRRVGVPRILDLLRKHGIPATFFIPGYTAEIGSELVKQIVAEGHTVGCHGYYHERTDTLTYEQEDQILGRSVDTLTSLMGSRPIGFRAPLWEVTPQTLTLLGKHGFSYDSSLMGLDHPYFVRIPDSDQTLFEVPVTWLLDDWEQFAYSAEPSNGYVIEEPEKVFRMWRDEFDALHEEGRAFTLTMHPEVIGRASRVRMLDRLIQHIKQQSDVWFCTLDQLHAAMSQGRLNVPILDY